MKNNDIAKLFKKRASLTNDYFDDVEASYERVFKAARKFYDAEELFEFERSRSQSKFFKDQHVLAQKAFNTDKAHSLAQKKSDRDKLAAIGMTSKIGTVYASILRDSIDMSVKLAEQSDVLGHSLFHNTHELLDSEKVLQRLTNLQENLNTNAKDVKLNAYKQSIVESVNLIESFEQRVNNTFDKLLETQQGKLTKAQTSLFNKLTKTKFKYDVSDQFADKAQVGVPKKLAQQISSLQRTHNAITKAISQKTESNIANFKQEFEETVATVKQLRDVERHQEKIKREQEAVNEAFGSTLDTVRSTGHKLTTIIQSPLVAIATLAAIIGSEIVEWADSVIEQRKELGLTIQQMKTLATDNKAAYLQSKLYGYEATKIQSQLVEHQGHISHALHDMVGNAGMFAAHTGVSSEAAAQLAASFIEIPGMTSKSATDMMNFTAGLAEANHVPIGTLVSSMANGTEHFALYTKQGGQNIVKAAVQAKKLAVEMSTIAGIADNLLDFESSIQKEMEASVLLGQEVNFNRARELALTGDLTGMTAEVMRQVGGEAKWNKMNVIQRKAIADAVGVSASEMQKMVANNKEAAKLDEAKLKMYEAGNKLLLAAYNLMTNTGLKVVMAGLAMLMLIKNLTTAGTILHTNILLPWKSTVGWIKEAGVWVINLARRMMGIKPLEIISDKMMSKGSAFLDKILPKRTSALLDKLRGVKKQPLESISTTQPELPKPKSSLKDIVSKRKVKKLKKVDVEPTLEHIPDKRKKLKPEPISTLERAPKKLKKVDVEPTLERIPKKQPKLKKLESLPDLNVPTKTSKPKMEIPSKVKGKSFFENTKYINNLSKSTTVMIKGAAALVVFAGALWITAKALQEFNTVNWGDVSKGAVAISMLAGTAFVLNKASKQMYTGAAAVTLLGASLIPFAGAMMLLKKADLSNTLLPAAAALGVFSAAVFGLGALMSTGAGAFLFGAGLLAISGLGVSMSVFGAGLMTVGSGITSIIDPLTTLSTQINTLVKSVGGMFEVGAGLLAISAGLGSIATTGMLALPAIAAMSMATKLTNPIPLTKETSVDQLSQNTQARQSTPLKEQSQQQVPQTLNTEPITSKLDELINLLKKGGNVYMDGKKVGEVVRLAIPQTTAR